MKHKYWFDEDCYYTSFSNDNETVLITKRIELVLVGNAMPELCLMNELDFETEKEYREFTGDYSFF